MPQPFPFDELIVDLDEIDRWLRGRGLQAHDRIRRYRKNIKEMIEVQRRDERLESLQNITEERRREIFWSYVEAEEFARAVRSLRATLGDELPAAPVKNALDGPADLFLESSIPGMARLPSFRLESFRSHSAASRLKDSHFAWRSSPRRTNTNGARRSAHYTAGIPLYPSMPRRIPANSSGLVTAAKCPASAGTRAPRRFLVMSLWQRPLETA